jgi:hypothetical protein
MISGRSLRKRFAGPQDHRCCWYRNALNVLGSSFFTCETHKQKERRVERVGFSHNS